LQPTRLRPDLLLVLARTDQHDVAELVGTVRYRYDPALEPSRHGLEPGAVLIPQFTNPAGRYSDYADLYVHAALDVDGYVNEGAYRVKYEYRPGVVDLHLAQSTTHVLRHLDRQMTELAQQLGAPNDFAGYLTHFAAALGITVFAEDCAKLQPNGTHWKWIDVEQMHAWVRQHERTPAPVSGRL
jgi:hypothetical protein